MATPTDEQAPVDETAAPADTATEDTAAADVVVPPNAAAAITADDVEQHLDIDPNDPRNVPQPGLLPLTTDADQQAPKSVEPVSTADEAESLPSVSGDVTIADGVVAHLDNDPNDPRRFLPEFGAK